MRVQQREVFEERLADHGDGGGRDVRRHFVLCTLCHYQYMHIQAFLS